MVSVVALDDPFPPDRDATGSETPAGTPTPPWQHGHTVDVPADGSVEHPDFVTEPGGYKIFARLDTGATAMETHNFGTAAGGDGVTGGIMAVSIWEHGGLSIYSPVDD